MRSTLSSSLLMLVLAACGEPTAANPSSSSEQEAEIEESSTQDRAFLDAMVGTAPGLFPWEGSTSVLGQTREAFRAAHQPDHHSNAPDESSTSLVRAIPTIDIDIDSMSFMLEGHDVAVLVGRFAMIWPDEQIEQRFDELDTSIPERAPEYQVVESFTLIAEVEEHTYDALRERLVTQYVQARSVELGEVFLDPQRGRQIVLARAEGSFVMSVERYMPLASLFRASTHFGIGERDWRTMSDRELVVFGNGHGWFCGSSRCSLPPNENASQGTSLTFTEEGLELEINAPIGSEVQAIEAEIVAAIANSFGPPSTPENIQSEREWHLRYAFAEGVALRAWPSGNPNGPLWRVTVPREVN